MAGDDKAGDGFDPTVERAPVRNERLANGGEALFSRLAVFGMVRTQQDPDLIAAVLSYLGSPEAPGCAWVRSGAAADWSRLDGTSAMAGLDHQIVLDAERCCSLLGLPRDAAPACLTVDLTPTEVPPTPLVLISVVVGAWTHWPESDELAPPLPPGMTDVARTWTADEVAEILDQRYNPDVIQAVLNGLFGEINVAAPTVNGKVALPPTAYLAVPAGDWPVKGEDWFLPVHSAPARGITRSVLMISAPGDERLAGSIQDTSGTVTLYRSFTQSSSVFANFLFLPSGDRTVDNFEAEVRRLVRFFDVLDTQAAFTLWDARTDLEQVSDRAGDCTLIAREAPRVLRPLLLGLTSPEDHHVERVQSAVDLVRTILLQIGHLGIDLRSTLERHESTVAVLQVSTEQQRRDLGERTPPGMAHVDETLVRSGHFEQLRFLVRRAAETLSGVTPTRDLMDNVAAVLVERREQTLARLEGATSRLNVALFILAAASTLDLLVHFNWERTYSWVAPLLRTALVVGLVGVAGWYVVQSRHNRKRRGVEAELLDLRRRVVAFLQSVGRTSGQGAPDHFDPVADAADALELASIWEAIDQAGIRVATDAERLTSDDQAGVLDHQVDRAELWSVTALLIVGRPFPLTARLPLVTSLLHFRSGGQFVSPFEFGLALTGVLPAARVDEYRQWGIATAPLANSSQQLLKVVEAKLVEMASVGEDDADVPGLDGGGGVGVASAPVAGADGGPIGDGVAIGQGIL